jgi:hypothetical protein
LQNLPKLEHTKQSQLAEKDFIHSNNFTSIDNSIHVSGIRNQITSIKRKEFIVMNNNNDLKELVNEDKQHIINFLKHHNIKVKNNEVSLLFSDGEVDEATIDQQAFINLWELQYEPSLVKVEFTIESLNERSSNVQEVMESLINQLTTRGWHVDPYDSPNQSKTIEDNYNCFQKINIEKKSIESDETKIVLFAAIGYFN